MKEVNKSKKTGLGGREEPFFNSRRQRRFSRAHDAHSMNIGTGKLFKCDLNVQRRHALELGRWGGGGGGCVGGGGQERQQGGGLEGKSEHKIFESTTGEKKKLNSRSQKGRGLILM